MTLEDLYQIIKARKENMPSDSYVATLFRLGDDRLIQKVGEEATEVVIAAKNKNKKRMVSEVADLWFHLLALLVSKSISVETIMNELQKRTK